jgi:hypothetical protein
MDWFGKKAKDVVTGFSGIAIGYCQYNTGCNQILIAPGISKDGTFQESRWFDEQRVKFIPGKQLVINNAGLTGHDLIAPVK